jgi:hypothetical protein
VFSYYIGIRALILGGIIAIKAVMSIYRSGMAARLIMHNNLNWMLQPKLLRAEAGGPGRS